MLSEVNTIGIFHSGTDLFNIKMELCLSTLWNLCIFFFRLKITMISSQQRKAECIYRIKEATTFCMTRHLQTSSK